MPQIVRRDLVNVIVQPVGKQQVAVTAPAGRAAARPGCPAESNCRELPDSVPLRYRADIPRPTLTHHIPGGR